jgi:hypothetical protein
MDTDFNEHANALIMHVGENGTQDVRDFLHDRGLDDDYAFNLTEELKRRGMVRATYSGGGEIQCELTGAGRSAADKLVKSRSANRVGALRHRMLAWLDEHTDAIAWTEFLASDHAHHDQRAFTEAELAREAQYLHDHGLIKSIHIEEGNDGMIQPQITARGRDALHQADTHSSSAHSVEAPSYVMNNTFNAPVSGSQFATGTTVSQRQQNVISEVPEQYQELAMIVTLLLEQLPQYPDVPEEDKEDIDAAATDVLAEIADTRSPEPKRVRRAVNALSGALGRIGTAAAAGAAAGAQSGAQDWAHHGFVALSNLTF